MENENNSEPLNGQQEQSVDFPGLPKDIEKLRVMRKIISCLEQAKLGALRRRDEASVYADAWACSFRQLSNDQQIHAKQVIDEVLYLGRLKKLSHQTVITFDDNEDKN